MVNSGKSDENANDFGCSLENNYGGGTDHQQEILLIKRASMITSHLKMKTTLLMKIIGFCQRFL